MLLPSFRGLKAPAPSVFRVKTDSVLESESTCSSIGALT